MTTTPTVEVDPHHIGTNSIHYIPSKIYSIILSAFGNLSYAPKNRCDDTNRTKVKTHLKAPTDFRQIKKLGSICTSNDSRSQAFNDASAFVITVTVRTLARVRVLGARWRW